MTTTLPHRPRRRPALPAVLTLRAGLGAGLLVVLLAACTSGSSTDGPTAQTPAQVLAATKTTVDAATSLHLTITGKDLPSSFDGVVSADGVGTHAPAFKGTFQVRVGTTQASAAIVAVDGKTYAKLPFTSLYAAVSPSSLGAPDPAQLFTPATGITSLLTATQDPKAAGQKRQGADVLTTYTGTLPGQTVHDLLVVGESTSSYAVTYGITGTGELRTVSLTGPFYAGTTSTYDVTLDQYGAPVEITKP